MKGIIVLAMVVLAISMIFFGCTGIQPTPKVTSDSEASKALVDVGTDISGISQSLNSIDKTLIDTNSP